MRASLGLRELEGPVPSIHHRRRLIYSLNELRLPASLNEVWQVLVRRPPSNLLLCLFWPHQRADRDGRRTAHKGNKNVRMSRCARQLLFAYYELNHFAVRRLSSTLAYLMKDSIALGRRASDSWACLEDLQSSGHQVVAFNARLFVALEPL